MADYDAAAATEALNASLTKIRHHTSSKLENQRAPALLLAAIETGIAEHHAAARAAGQAAPPESASPSPTEYLVGMLSMVPSATSNSGAVSLPALLYLIALAVPHVPTSVLYKEIDPLLRILQGPLSNPHATTDSGSQGAQDNLAAQLRSVLNVLDIALVNFPLKVLAHTPLQQSFNSTLKLCIDVRPKVRRRAQQLVLATLQRDDGDHPYAPHVLAWLVQSFDRVGEASGSKFEVGKPEFDKKTGRALHSSASAALRQNALELQNEAKARRGANVKLHPSAGVWLTGFAKELIPVLHAHGALGGKTALEGLVKALIRLPSLQNPFLSVGAFDDFQVLFRQRLHDGSSGLLQTTIRTLRSRHVRNQVSSDAQLYPAYLHALASALTALARYDSVAAETGGKMSSLWDSKEDSISALPIFTDVLARALGAGVGAQSKLVREAGKALLLAIIKALPRNKIVAAASAPKEHTEVKSIVEQLQNALEGQAVKFLASRGELLGVIEGVIEQLRTFVPDARSPVPQAHVNRDTPRAAEIFCLPFITLAAAMRSDESFEYRVEADAVLAKAVSVCGPGVVLEILPLNVLGEMDDEPERTWLLPLMARQIDNTELAHFAEVLLPLTKELDERRADAEARRQDSRAAAAAESLMWSTLIKQIWDLFPGYCKLPLDAVPALSETTLAAELVDALKRSQDPSSRWVRVGPSILGGLQQLVETSRSIKASGMGSELEANFGLTPADGERNLAKLAEMAPGFTTALYDVLRLSPREDQGFIIPTMALFIDLLSTAALEGAFQHLLTTLGQALAKPRDPKQKSNPNSPQSELVTSLRVLGLFVPHLTVAQASTLLTGLLGDSNDKSQAVAPALLTDKAASLQKRAYNLYTRIVEASNGPAVLATKGANGVPLLLTLLKAVTLAQTTVAPGAEDERMELLSALVPRIPLDQLHLLHPFTTEGVLGTKGRGDERKGSFTLLLALADKFKAGGTINMKPLTGVEGTRAASLEEFFLVVSGLLGGSTPHEISATWMALNRLLYEYRRDLSPDSISELLQTAATFVRSQNREIIKSVLGTMNVAAVGADSSLLLADNSKLLRTLVEAVFALSKENRYRFKLPVRHFCERLVRRFGYNAIDRYVPEDDKKLLANIRKRKERAKRRRTEKEAGADFTDTALGAAQAVHKPRETGADAFEDVLYGSEDELASSDEEDSAPKKGKAPAGKKDRRQAEDAYIRADDDEPMDLLDRGAAGSKIMTGSGHAAVQARATAVAGRANRKGASFPSDADSGKMLIEDEEDATAKPAVPGTRGKKRKSGDDVDMDVDEDGEGDAYLGMSLGADGHTHTRTGAVRFNKNNKKTRAAEAEMELDEDEARQIGAPTEEKSDRRKRQKKEKTAIGSQFRAKKAKGDVQRGGMSPYAYVPLGDVSGKKAGRSARQMDITGHGRKRRS